MRIGVLGGGQLGRMLALAGLPLGLDFVFYDRNPNACASAVGELFSGAIDDIDSLKRFSSYSDILTVESENIDYQILSQLATERPVKPGLIAIKTAQDRLLEKQLFREAGIPTPAFYTADTAEQLFELAKEHGDPLIIKTRRFGYDGKGQAMLTDPGHHEEIWSALGNMPVIAEQIIDFSREVSLIAVRNESGEIKCYPLTENFHHEGILLRSKVTYDDPQQSNAERYATKIMNKLDYVGVLAFEFFEEGGTLIANEIAPRVHNSGHWTIEGAVTSQFENHLRAILGWPLGDTRSYVPCMMYNLIGKLPDRTKMLSIPGCHLHDYNKPPRPGRKLGHVTVCDPSEQAMRSIESNMMPHELPR